MIVVQVLCNLQRFISSYQYLYNDLFHICSYTFPATHVSLCLFEIKTIGSNKYTIIYLYLFKISPKVE